ncbi:MAG: SOS response-associated peptidase family protein [Lacibacter sp.]
MCYYNGCRVSRADYIRLMAIEKEIRNLLLLRKVQSGFDYGNWPVIKPINGGKDFELTEMHWEYIPYFIKNAHELKESRKMFTWLNAKAENLFVNDKGRMSMYKEGATKGRCLALSSGFYEWRHIPKIGKKGLPLKQTEKIPYYITLKNEPEYFFMAAVSREWENIDMQQSAETFAIVTTEANELMQKVHNSKKRMPVILPEELAFEWIQPGLTEQRIKELAAYQIKAEDMIAWPVAKNFLDTEEDPATEFMYDQLPAL